MKKIIFNIFLLLMLSMEGIFSQATENTEVYLLTCGPGTETYSIYGHSALRIVIPEMQTDNVYNWGVFDFDTPHFAWKFAKGRLDYMLDAVTYKGFLQGYIFEKRYVESQEINLNAEEKGKLISLINENLKPENRKYRYDFFYDDCSTRIRDLLEKSVGDKLLYPPAQETKLPTFRELTGKYQSPYPWLKFGVDLIMGSPGDKRASFRDRMFLPVDMQKGLSQLVIRRQNGMIPLLQNPEGVLDFEAPVIQNNIFNSPATIFTLFMILVIIVSNIAGKKLFLNIMDLIIFLIFTVLAVLMVFFNFFTDHLQMKWNLNILWLNPVIILCFIALLTGKAGTIWFRIVFLTSVIFLILQFILPQAFNFAIFPLIIILMIRTLARSGFSWSPLSME